MPTTSGPQTANRGDTPPLDEVLEKSKQVSEEVKDAAEELGVVHAVLDTQLAKKPTHEDVQEAVSRTQELEKRLMESAEKLDSAAETLEKEISKA